MGGIAMSLSLSHRKEIALQASSVLGIYGIHYGEGKSSEVNRAVVLVSHWANTTYTSPAQSGLVGPASLPVCAGPHVHFAAKD